MNTQGFKKGDIVKLTTDDGEVQVLKINKVTRKGIVGDSYNFEKKYKTGGASAYKIGDKNITINKKDATKIEAELMQSNLRIKVKNTEIKKVQEDEEEEKINTRKRGTKRSRKSMSNRRRSPTPEAKQMKVPDGRRVVAKKSSPGKKGTSNKKKRDKTPEEVDMSKLTEKERQKLERIRIREEKKKERERKRRLKQIEPNKDIELIEYNPLIEDVQSKRLEEFPLEGCSKFSDNRKFLYLYFQGKSNKKARKELENLLLKDSSLSNPFMPYSHGLEK